MEDLKYRVGQGFDIHAFSEQDPLIIGGVKIDYPRGLKGHSDADVLLHAVTDALIGAIGDGDIGSYFPDDDPQYKNANSRILLKTVYEEVKKRGYSINNLDATIIAQTPKMRPYISDMIISIASDLQCDPSQVNVKAKTMEHLGCVGREEGIIAEAIVMIQKTK